LRVGFDDDLKRFSLLGRQRGKKIFERDLFRFLAFGARFKKTLLG